MLNNSTLDGMRPKVAYSLNKSKRWEMVSSPEALVDQFTSVDQAYPVAAADRAFVGSGYTNRAYAEKAAPDQNVKSIRVKSGKGADILSLRDSLMDKPTTSEKKSKPKPGQSLMEFVEAPSILYCVEEHHADELLFRRLLGKSKVGGRTTKKVKNVEYDGSEESDFDGDVDADAADNSDGSTRDDDAPKPSTLGDFLVTKPSKKGKKKRTITEQSFEIIDESPDVSSTTSKPEPSLTNTTQLALASKTEIRYINVDSECLTLPNLTEMEFMFDFMWLNDEKTRCLFTVPKGCDDTHANFSSVIILELMKNKRKHLR